MTRVSSVLNNPHKEEIDKLLNDGYRVSEVLKILKDRGISLSRGKLYRYKNHYFVPKRKMNDRLYRILLDTGNYNLLKSLEKTQRIYETKRRCKCANVYPEHLRRSGRVFIHQVCGGWYPYDLGVYLQNKQKKSRVSYRFVSATARSY